MHSFFSPLSLSSHHTSLKSGIQPPLHCYLDWRYYLLVRNVACKMARASTLRTFARSFVLEGFVFSLCSILVVSVTKAACYLGLNCFFQALSEDLYYPTMSDQPSKGMTLAILALFSPHLPSAFKPLSEKLVVSPTEPRLPWVVVQLPCSL